MTTSPETSTRSSLPATTHTGQVHLRVSDLERSLGFYRDILGYTVTGVGERSVKLTASPTQLAQIQVDEVTGVPPKPWKSAGLYHAAIRVPSRTELARTIKRLVDHNWKVPGVADHGVSEAFYLNDPDGNGLEIYADRPRANWPVKDGALQMISDPLDLESLFGTLEGAPADDGSMAPDSDIGHVHLQVSDLTRAERFYVDILGFDVMQRTYQGALFVSAGGYHHHIGLNVWAGRGVPAPRNDVAGLIDFTILLPDSDSLDTVAHRLNEAKMDFERSTAADDRPSLSTHDLDGIGVVLAVENA